MLAEGVEEGINRTEPCLLVGDFFGNRSMASLGKVKAINQFVIPCLFCLIKSEVCVLTYGLLNHPGYNLNFALQFSLLFSRSEVSKTVDFMSSKFSRISSLSESSLLTADMKSFLILLRQDAVSGIDCHYRICDCIGKWCGGICWWSAIPLSHTKNRTARILSYLKIC